MKRKLLLVEDEKNFGAVLRDYLSMNDYEVVLCENGELGLEAFKQSSFDLCLIDVMMPKKDGFTFATEIAALKTQVPFLFLTAKSMKDDVIKGYKLGAADYIIKPFDSEVLLYKINSILHRQKNIEKKEVFKHIIGDFEFNYKLRTLTSTHQNEKRLSPKEAELLHLLCLHLNDVVPREKALNQIWKNDNYFTARSMDVYIVKLRKYLSTDPSIAIVNLHGNGYSLRDS